MQEDDIERIYERGGEGLTLYSASGPVSTQEAVDMCIEVLGEETTQMVVDATPDLLSVGYRCEELGYGFVWEPYFKNPYTTVPKPDGSVETIILESENYTPFLYDYQVDRAKVRAYRAGEIVITKDKKRKRSRSRGKRKNELGCPAPETGDPSSLDI